MVLEALSAANAATSTGAFAEIHRGQPGDPRGSTQDNLAADADSRRASAEQRAPVARQ
jgi:hypothetical protein